MRRQALGFASSACNINQDLMKGQQPTDDPDERQMSPGAAVKRRL